MGIYLYNEFQIWIKSEYNKIIGDSLNILSQADIRNPQRGWTFPFVISAIASKQTMACAANMGNPLPFLKYVVLIETIIAVLFVAYTFIRYMGFLFGGKK